ncbi:hypothetical protein J2Q11_05240 [Tenacibaculum finnmarkense genomovar finnmarkense]|uniref:Peptidylprolyl isomerase n=1 Tax=Tenacibaculum finnmarkense genomovar finnmarkense TaxID=1458503 RepID=A0AAP1RFD6_9FLAO|nr:hypothetical protein [Tenacibaculum finnmarkense]MBE7652603.1 hypothetical protein [Tenacibaculum finnmarkense genomovar finnmarkense]MBE7660250.1 hypothetical protein [Tenacibaculum finnmarkense genomovar finnmarkense]MBE7694902.1 hypothetical protein [Tenacibaculum finnmarkense genomovar finnmarkense]MCD8412198.1 hypothetical protein [Tenacibaculum finnmarkense genomovar ulcerans]MCD8416921.1 hypothetical protein [Tenacibaculum finnmarkense genomovar finnmarkense]
MSSKKHTISKKIIKKTFFFLIALSIVSCDFISLKTKKVSEQHKPIATVYNKNLYKKDIEELLPKDINPKDSVVMTRGFIYSWAKKQLLLAKAEENISELNSKKIAALVHNYKNSLYINGYKERLIKQQLDTVVALQEIETYYYKNKENFKLNEEILQFEYINFGKDFLDKAEVIKNFKSSKQSDREELERYLLNFKSYRLGDTTWVPFSYLPKIIPPFQLQTTQSLLKISKYIQKEDSLGVYLVAVKKRLPKNASAPLIFVRPRIKQIILHKRKLELIREIEKTLINDAIQNKNFKEY